MSTAPSSVTFAEAFRFWLKLGFISFGGPAGQIAIMHTELVERRRWISEKRFLHALNYCMVLPGPEAQQLATYTGWLMNGVRGGLIAGTLFVLPGFLVMLALAALAAYGAAFLVRGRGWRARAVVACLGAAFLAESFLVDFPGGKPKPFDVPEVYHRLQSMPPGAVLSLPSYRGTPQGFREADYLLYSTVHWHPIANGFGRHEPLAHKDNLAALVQFPATVSIERLRALGITSAQPSALAPDLPTMQEAGVAGYEVAGWYGVLAPAKTPRPIIEKLNKEIVRILHSSDIQSKLAADGSEPVGNTPEQFGAHIKSEVAKWAKVVREANIRAE
mgnify:CR=1 FL=1